jgi:hypothetical protein
MNITGLKKIIKESVKEAIQEELKEILLESIKSSKTPVVESQFRPQTQVQVEPTRDLAAMRQSYMSVLGETANNLGQDTLSFNTNSFVPRPVNTAAEGSSLPPGEVDLSQIASLLNMNK